MKLTSGVRFGALAVAAALMAGACGSSADDGTATGGTVIDDGARGAAQSALDNTTSTAAASAAPTEITSMEDWQALWKNQREALVAEIEGDGARRNDLKAGRVDADYAAAVGLDTPWDRFLEQAAVTLSDGATA